MRRAAHDGFNVRASATYQVLQEKESILLASHFLRDPARWGEHFGRSAASTVLSAVYGWPPIDTSADALVERIDALTKRAVNASAPGAHLVEILPSMLCLPEWLAKWKREGREWFRKDSALFEGFFDEVEMKLVCHCSLSYDLHWSVHQFPENRKVRTLFCSKSYRRRGKI